MCEELCALFERLRFEPGINLVIMRGYGPSFCAGVVVKELVAHDTGSVSRSRHRGLDAYVAIKRYPVPTLCVTYGAVIGPGREIAAGCDFVLSLDTAFCQRPEALRDNIGTTRRLPRIVGRSAARELLFTARRINSAMAVRLGFVNRMDDGHEVLETAVAEGQAEILGFLVRANRLRKHAMSVGESCVRATAVDIGRQTTGESLRQLADPFKAAKRQRATHAAACVLTAIVNVGLVAEMAGEDGRAPRPDRKIGLTSRDDNIKLGVDISNFKARSLALTQIWEMVSMLTFDQDVL